jgi:hypothetical protein
MNINESIFNIYVSSFIFNNFENILADKYRVKVNKMPVIMDKKKPPDKCSIFNSFNCINAELTPRLAINFEKLITINAPLTIPNSIGNIYLAKTDNTKTFKSASIPVPDKVQISPEIAISVLDLLFSIIINVFYFY